MILNHIVKVQIMFGYEFNFKKICILFNKYEVSQFYENYQEK